jgi:hypothetical protein
MVPLQQRRALRSSIAVFGVLVAASGLALAQRYGSQPGPETTVFAGGPGRAIVGAVLTVLIGGLLVAVSPSYSEGITERTLKRTGSSFVTGFLAFIGFLLVLFFGMLLQFLVIPAILALLATVIYILVVLVGSTLGYLALGRAVTDSWGGALVVAALLGAFGSGVPVIGSLFSLVITFIGTGAMIANFQDSGAAHQADVYSTTQTPGR